jgi:hypothetical protein
MHHSHVMVATKVFAALVLPNTVAVIEVAVSWGAATSIAWDLRGAQIIPAIEELLSHLLGKHWLVTGYHELPPKGVM